MNQELKQILELLGESWIEIRNADLNDEYPDHKTVAAEYDNSLKEAHSAIIETIKKALPEDMDTDGSYGKYPSGWNDCLEQIKSNL